MVIMFTKLCGLSTSAKIAATSTRGNNIHDNIAVAILKNSNTVPREISKESAGITCSSARGLVSQRNILSTISLDIPEHAYQAEALKQVKLPRAGTLAVKRGRVYFRRGRISRRLQYTCTFHTN